MTEAAGADIETRDFEAEGLPERVVHHPGGSQLKLSVRNTVEPVVLQ